MFYLAVFASGGNYLCDREIIGLYDSKEKAEKEIQICISSDKSSHPGYPARYEQRRDYYSITEMTLNERHW